jgi:hypothetical protein
MSERPEMEVTVTGQYQEKEEDEESCGGCPVWKVQLGMFKREPGVLGRGEWICNSCMGGRGRCVAVVVTDEAHQAEQGVGITGKEGGLEGD